ncbi:L-threonylcarbamoyladenylate synthase [Cetobacterium ceti]|uniref:L-threonylcarbamoyladenylate synthase n=1 Tax=Cetobacterium ceti TaxID=180163 RepID=A0A1T4NT44_9FUSO|nr:L-threonylcarbamoyladenylate synthase [Cetobacterium ceti]
MKNILFHRENMDLQLIKDKLNSGEIIIYPTDTVYGVGATIESLEGIEKIYKAKERNFSSPLIALVSDIKHIDKIAMVREENRDLLKKLGEKFWPGGLTIILEKKDIVPGIMVSNGKTVGVRMPNLDISLEIIEAVGGIMPTTSANISGEKTPRSYEELSEKFKERVEILVDGGKSPLGLESTIIDISTSQIKILREGAIKKEEIEKVIGKF